MAYRRPYIPFDDRYMPEPNSGCWLWIGSIDTHGYGNFMTADPVARSKQKTRLAHRHAYETYVGPIPEGLQIDHKCRVRSCVNPAHLEPVTQSENVRRGGLSPEKGRLMAAQWAAARRAQTHCKRGHPLSGSNLLLVPTGRQCRTCRNEYAKLYMRRVRQLAKQEA